MLQFLSSRLRMGARLKVLLRVMDRLDAGDTGVEVPFLGDRTDTGRIAARLEAFRRRLTEAQEERRRAEQANSALRESEARYRLLAENTGDMVIQYDVDFRPVYVSPSVKSLGYEPGALLAEGISGLIHPDDLARAAARRDSVSRGLLVKPATGKMRAADGRWVWVESTITPMFDDAGERVGFITTLRDIDERKLAEQALIDSEARYRLLADNTGDIILQYDPDFRPLYVSPSIKHLGYAPDVLMTHSFSDVIHPDDLVAAAARRDAAKQGEPIKPIAARILTADGGWKWFESTLTQVIDDAGERVGFISTLRDIGERKLAEQALIEGEARYRMLAENVTDVLLRYGADARIEYVSPSVRQWGYEQADFIGKPAGHFVHPDDQELVVDRRAAMARGDPNRQLEIRLMRADGTWTWVESNPAYIRGPDQEVIGAVLVMRDIGARKAAEVALIESEARYRMLADNIGDVLLRYDNDLRIDYVSPSIRQWGYSREEFIGQPVGHFVHPDDQAQVAERRSALLRGEAVPPGECRVRRADGSWIWAESSPALIRDEHGAARGIMLVLRDIEQRKQAETALVESEARYRMLAEYSSDVLLRYDADQRIAYVSPSVRQWGYTPEDFIGQRAGVFVHPEDQERITERRVAMLAGEPVQTVEARIRRADGSWTWIESNPAQIRDDSGAVVGAVLVLRDINQRKTGRRGADRQRDPLPHAGRQHFGHHPAVQRRRHRRIRLPFGAPARLRAGVLHRRPHRAAGRQRGFARRGAPPPGHARAVSRWRRWSPGYTPPTGAPSGWKAGRPRSWTNRASSSGWSTSCAT